MLGILLGILLEFFSGKFQICPFFKKRRTELFISTFLGTWQMNEITFIVLPKFVTIFN